MGMHSLVCRVQSGVGSGGLRYRVSVSVKVWYPSEQGLLASGKYSVAVSRGPTARGIPSQRVVRGPVWVLDQASGVTEVRQAPALVAYDPVDSIVAVGPRERSSKERLAHSIQAALQVTTAASGPVVGP